MRNPLSLVKGAFSLVQENISLFFGIVLVPVVLSVVVGLFTPSQATGVINVTDWSVYLVLLLVATIFNVLMSIALILAIDNRSLTVTEAYKQAMPIFVRYILFSLLMSLIILVAFLLLIIPGIIVSVWLTFASFVLILEKAPIIASMKQSREYVRGKWFNVFLRLVVISLLALVVSVVGSIISGMTPVPAVSSTVEILVSLAIMPVAVAYMYLMYKDVKGEKAGTATAASVAPTPAAPTTPTPTI